MWQSSQAEVKMWENLSSVKTSRGVSNRTFLTHSHNQKMNIVITGWWSYKYFDCFKYGSNLNQVSPPFPKHRLGSRLQESRRLNCPTMGERGEKVGHEIWFNFSGQRLMQRWTYIKFAEIQRKELYEHFATGCISAYMQYLVVVHIYIGDFHSSFVIFVTYSFLGALNHI